MSTVVLHGVGKRYGRVPALTGIDLGLRRGVTGLLGPNGAGKTTLLRIVATALAADTGSVEILGQEPATAAGRTRIRRQLGYLPQEAGFPRGFTVFRFVDYFAILKEWDDSRTRHDEVRRVIDAVDLTAVATKRVHALSGGQRRRVLLAQALLGNPDLLVLDEPTNGLDPAQRARLRDLLSTAGQDSTLLLSTHQTDDVAALCERVIVLDGGRVRFDGAVTALVATAQGHVWTAGSRDLTARHSWFTGTGRWRHVGTPPPGAVLAEPTLDDAYLLLAEDATVPAEVGAPS